MRAVIHTHWSTTWSSEWVCARRLGCKPYHQLAELACLLMNLLDQLPGRGQHKCDQRVVHHTALPPRLLPLLLADQRKKYRYQYTPLYCNAIGSLPLASRPLKTAHACSEAQPTSPPLLHQQQLTVGLAEFACLLVDLLSQLPGGCKHQPYGPLTHFKFRLVGCGGFSIIPSVRSCHSL